MFTRQKPDLKNVIQVARKKKPADIVLKNCNVINVFSHEIYTSDVAIVGSIIAAVGDGYHGKMNIDLTGKCVCPGLIDGHLHVESSMSTIPEFARVVVPHGTTTIIIDPHEIANVMGMLGISYILKTSKYNPLNVYVMLPSCVPATPMETAGAELKAIDLFPMLQDRWILGLGEVMNFPGILECHDEILDKIKISEGRVIDGHAPGVLGPDLNAYIAAGMRSDHECTSPDEALQKLRLGMHIMLREGSTTKNLIDLLPLVNPDTISQCFFVTDDRDPIELMDHGHIDHMVRLAICNGVDPISAIKLATINTAKYFGLSHIGAIAPGYDADILVIDDLEHFSIESVFKNGQCVAQHGVPLYERFDHDKIQMRGSVNVKWIERDQFCIPPRGDRIRVIEIIPEQIVTRTSIYEHPKVQNNNIVSDTERDLLKFVVIERHYGSGQMGLGFIRGFGLKCGAIASTIAHDSHNIISVGVSDVDIYDAVVQLVRQQGGLAISEGNGCVDGLPLPIGGLMSDSPVSEIRLKLDHLIRKVQSMGCILTNPFMTLAFMALPVIPELKLTDKGLFDVSTFSFVDLFV